MSSSYVRSEVLSFLTTNFPSEKIIDLSGEYEYLTDFLLENNISNEKWIGLQFNGGQEEPITVNSTNISGDYRELGIVLIHIVEPARLGVGALILSRAESIRDALRGQRIGNRILIDSMTPPNFEAGATLEFTGGYTSAAIIVSYQYDFSL